MSRPHLTERALRAPSPPLRGSADASRQAHLAWEAGRRAKSAGQWQVSRRHFERAVALAPRDALYRTNLARAAQILGDDDTATREARIAFDLDRANGVACDMLGDALRRQRRHREVIEALDQLDPATPRSADWHLCRAGAWLELRDFGEATRDASQALALAASDPRKRLRALRMLGHGLSMLRRHAEAGWCYRMVLDADPLALGSALYAAHYSAWSCDWPNLLSDLDRLQTCIDRVQAEADAKDVEPLSPFCLLTLTDNPAVLHWTARLATLKGGAAVQPRDDRQPVPRPGGRLRIGLLSADFHLHATSILIAEVLEAMDPDRYEWVFYSGGPDDGSELRARIRATAGIWHETREWTTEALAERIRADQIGVLVDMKGYTLGSRMGVMAQRPAPIQISWLGYPGTTGADYIDYVVGDPVVTPLEAQVHFSERIAQMPHCYQPNDRLRSRPTPDTRAEHGLPAEAFVFASFNQSYKIVPEVFQAWCRLLAERPDAVLWLLVPQEDVQQRLRQEAAARGIDPQRLIFAPFLGIEAHRRRLPLADLFLDSFPCSGHTTASDALWAGVPVVTLQGENFASRVAASLLHTLGLDELVCHDLDQYVARALHLAGDAAAAAALRERLQAGLRDSPLFDGRGYARDFADLLERMVDRQAQGLPPAPLPARCAATAGADLPPSSPEPRA